MEESLQIQLDMLRNEVEIVPGIAADADSIEICTGAVRELPTDVYPVLCWTPELASILWRDAVRTIVNGRKIRFVKMPVITKLMMTVTDRKQQQRLVSDRYAVTSRIVFVKD